MGTIYSQASNVVIWLGELSAPYEEAITFISLFSDACENIAVRQRAELARKVRPLFTGARSLSLTMLFQHDWFHRTWTYQELHSAQIRDDVLWNYGT